MENRINYKVLAISVVAAAIVFGYILLEAGKLEEAADAHRADAADLSAPAD